MFAKWTSATETTNELSWLHHTSGLFFKTSLLIELPQIIKCALESAEFPKPFQSLSATSKKENVSNYTPIAKLLFQAKMMEKIVFNHSAAIFWLHRKVLNEKRLNADSGKGVRRSCFHGAQTGAEHALLNRKKVPLGWKEIFECSCKSQRRIPFQC